MGGIKKIVLAYSGGLDTSIILAWLKDKYKCEVIAFVADVGQGEDLKKIEEKGYKTGADKVYIVDLKEEFVKNYVFEMFKMNAIYENLYLLGTSIARPVIAKAQVEIAKKENADAVAHGATGKGNDQVRFELTYSTLAPDLKIIAPWRIWEFSSRSDLIDYATKKGIDIPVTKDKPYSCDRNLLHISYEGGILEDPWREPDEDMFVMTRSPEKAPDQPTIIEIQFEKGVPVAVDGKRLSPVELLTHLNTVAGENGIGRIDIVENRFVGMKSRGVYETPGGTVLFIAHRALETITMDRELMYIRDTLIPTYSRLIYNGFWFSPERIAIQKLAEYSQQNVTGTVRLKLYKGNCIVLGRKATCSLFNEELATFEKDSMYNQKDAEGFIRLNALRLKNLSLSGYKLI